MTASLSRRQFLRRTAALAAALVLGDACASPAASTLISPVATTSARAATPPVATLPAPTATPSPTPADTAPPAALLQRVLGDYSKAMGGSLDAKELRQRDVKSTASAAISTLVAADGTPLLLREATGAWVEATLAPLADAAGLILETMMQVTRQEKGTWVDLRANRTYVDLVAGNANHIYTSGELDMSWVFGQFTTADWNRVLANWPTVLAQLRDGTVPTGFPYNWQGIDMLRQFAASNSLPLRAFHLVWGDDIPAAITNFGAADLKKILEFTVRARLLHCPDVAVWNIGDEILARSIYLRDQTGGLWPRLFGAPQIVGFVGKLVHEVRPKATLVVTEDMALETTFPDSRFSQWYLTYLQQIQDEGVKIGWADIENNFWVYDPPDPAKMDRVLGQVKRLGIKTITSEMTVAVSALYPNWPSRPKTVAIVKDPLGAQARIYQETLAAYQHNQTGAFGTGGVWDALAWQAAIGHPEAHAMIYDTAGRPKPSDYALRKQLLASFSGVT